MTLTFDLGVHGTCGWCGSSCSISVPSPNFVRLTVRKIRHILRVSINRPSDFHLETGAQVACVVGNLLTNFGLPTLFGSRVIRYVWKRQDRRTDRWTDRQKQRIMSLPYSGVGIIIHILMPFTGHFSFLANGITKVASAFGHSSSNISTGWMPFLSANISAKGLKQTQIIQIQIITVITSLMVNQFWGFSWKITGSSSIAQLSCWAE